MFRDMFDNPADRPQIYLTITNPMNELSEQIMATLNPAITSGVHASIAV